MYENLSSYVNMCSCVDGFVCFIVLYTCKQFEWCIFYGKEIIISQETIKLNKSKNSDQKIKIKRRILVPYNSIFGRVSECVYSSICAVICKQ